MFSVDEVIQWELGSVNEPQLGLVEVAGVKGLICLYLVPQSIPCALHTFLYSNTLVLPPLPIDIHKTGILCISKELGQDSYPQHSVGDKHCNVYNYQTKYYDGFCNEGKPCNKMPANSGALIREVMQ